MGTKITRLALVTAALAACLSFAGAPQAATFLDTDELTRFCTDAYGPNAIGEGPFAASFNQVDMQCAVPDASGERALAHTQKVEDVCTFLTGYGTWVNDRGVIVCIGQAALGGDTRRGSGSN